MSTKLKVSIIVSIILVLTLCILSNGLIKEVFQELSTQSSLMNEFTIK